MLRFRINITDFTEWDIEVSWGFRPGISTNSLARCLRIIVSLAMTKPIYMLHKGKTILAQMKRKCQLAQKKNIECK